MPTRNAPGSDFRSCALCSGEPRDRFESGLHVCISGHENAHIQLFADSHYDEINGKGDVNALLLWPFADAAARRPALGIAQRARYQRDERGPLPSSMLTTAGCIASWVELAVRLASVDPDLMKLPVKGTVAR